MKVRRCYVFPDEPDWLVFAPREALLFRTNLSGGDWMPVAGMTRVAGTGQLLELQHTNPPARLTLFYRVAVGLPSVRPGP